MLSIGDDIAPDAIQNISILENPQQLVVRGDLMKVGAFLIGKEQVWLPDGVQHGWIQIQGIVWILFISQPWIIPLLP